MKTRVLSSAIPEHIRRLMPAIARQQLGKEAWTAGEAQFALDDQSERELHDLIIQFLNMRGLYFVHSRMDRKSTIKSGAPDFHICAKTGCFIGIEVKIGAEQPTPEQTRELQRIVESGGKSFVVRSLQEVKTILDKEL